MFIRSECSSPRSNEKDLAMKYGFTSSLAVLALASVTVPAFAQTAGADPAFSATTLSLAATGEVKTTPDMATVVVGVDTAASSAAQAMSANAERMSRVIAALKAAGVAPHDLQTSNLSLSPQTVDENGKAPHVSGYQASNQLSATVRDLSRVGTVADAVVAAGATNIGQISFGLSNPLAAENAARLVAVKALQDKASLYAQANGYHVARLINLSEGETENAMPRPFRPMMAMRAVAPTPVETGDVAVRIDVNGIFELAR
jgi:uncharacterized protein YggE